MITQWYSQVWKLPHHTEYETYSFHVAQYYWFLNFGE
jgi:hypothetical protein